MSQSLDQGPFTVVAKQIVEEECPAIASPGNPALNLGVVGNCRSVWKFVWSKLKWLSFKNCMSVFEARNFNHMQCKYLDITLTHLCRHTMIYLHTFGSSYSAQCWFDHALLDSWERVLTLCRWCLRCRWGATFSWIRQIAMPRLPMKERNFARRHIMEQRIRSGQTQMWTCLRRKTYWNWVCRDAAKE